MWASWVLAPDREIFKTLLKPDAPPAVEVEERSRPVPVVKELAMTAAALPVVEGAVTDKVPLDTVKFPFVSTVNPATVEAELLSNPEVMVTKPEIVGVAVQAVGETVKPLPAIVVLYEALPKVVAADIP